MCGYWKRLTVRSVVDLHKNRQSRQEPTEFKFLAQVVANKWHQPQMTGAFDGGCQFALVFLGNTTDA